MENVIDRIRSKFRRTADRLTGQQVPVHTAQAVLENLEDRELLVPAVDILEGDKEVLIHADTPGAFADNTWVLFDERSGLSLYVRRAPRDAGRALFAEDAEGDWYRSFALPDYVDGQQARATIDQGVLSIHLPKRQTRSAVRVPVKAS